MSRYTATATDTVGYMGQPPTGKVIRTAAMQIFRFKNGKIVESWAVRDDLALCVSSGIWRSRGAEKDWLISGLNGVGHRSVLVRSGRLRQLAARWQQ